MTRNKVQNQMKNENNKRRLTMKKLTRLFALSALCCLCACGGASTDMNDEEEILTGKEDTSASRPYGTFRMEAANAGEFILLVLKTDKTFYYEKMINCVKAPCSALSLEGNFKFSKSKKGSYIRLLDEDDELLARYSYTYEDNTLELTDTEGDGDSFTMTRESVQGWCGVTADCELQNLTHPSCMGVWTCKENACDYSCGMPYTSPCKQAGGSCVALVPDACEFGIVGDAEEYSCGGGLGVMCCLPYPAAPVCDKIGSRSEGWYDGETGDLICFANCAGSEVRCDKNHSMSEGFYTDDGAGCMGNLIAYSNCQ
jgi:hypothetical protein